MNKVLRGSVNKTSECAHAIVVNPYIKDRPKEAFSVKSIFLANLYIAKQQREVIKGLSMETANLVAKISFIPVNKDNSLPKRKKGMVSNEISIPYLEWQKMISFLVNSLLHPWSKTIL